LVFGDTSGNQVIGNPMVKTVVVEPNFMVPYFGIKNQGMNSFVVDPAFINDEVAGSIVADDEFAVAAVGVKIERLTVFF
jgi:hypothetical protein